LEAAPKLETAGTVGAQNKTEGAAGEHQARDPEHDGDGAVLIEREVNKVRAKGKAVVVVEEGMDGGKEAEDKTEAVVDGKFKANLAELLEYRRLNGESFRW